MKSRSILVRCWWLTALRGAAAMGLALVLAVAPPASLDGWLALVGLYALADGGALALLALARFLGGEDFGWLGAAAAAGVLLALMTLIAAAVGAPPGLASGLIAVWAVAAGAPQLVAALHARQQHGGEELTVTAAAIVFGGGLAIAAITDTALIGFFFVDLIAFLAGAALLGHVALARRRSWEGAAALYLSLPAWLPATRARLVRGLRARIASW